MTTFSKLNDLNFPVVVARDISETGHKTYYGLNSKYDVFKLRDSLPEEERNLYEVLPGTTNRNLF